MAELHRGDLFPSPLFVFRDQGSAAFRDALRDSLLAESRAQPGVQASNVGGWHSARDLLTRPQPEFQALSRLVVTRFREVLDALGKPPPEPSVRIGGVAWAMVMGPGHYGAPHHHGDAHWASVFYVDAGDPPGPTLPAQAGCLTFLDPRGPRQSEDPLGHFHAAHDLRPQDGLLVFFPSWLQHFVHPYGGTRPRVSVSCNLHVTVR